MNKTNFDIHDAGRWDIFCGIDRSEHWELSCLDFKITMNNEMKAQLLRQYLEIGHIYRGGGALLALWSNLGLCSNKSTILWFENWMNV